MNGSIEQRDRRIEDLLRQLAGIHGELTKLTGNSDYQETASGLLEARDRLCEEADLLDLRVKERTAELEAIIASLPDAVYVGDENGIFRCNRRALDNLGCESIEELQDQIPVLNEKLDNRYADTGERIPPEDEAFARALRGQPWTYEVISYNRKTGQEIVQRCAANPILLDGRVIGAVAVNTDITEQKRVEAALREALAERLQSEATLAATAEKLRQAHDELELRVQERTAELVRREAALSETAARLETSREQLRALSRRLVQVQEDERRALSRDLHDTSSQAMTALKMGLAMLKHDGDCTEGMQVRIDDLRQIAETVAEDLHRLSVNLRPSSLDRYGLVPAVDQLLASVQKQAGMEMGFLVQGMEERLPGEVETALYRIIQEACTNITRHAAAKSASVLIQRRDETVQVIVEDDGQGFDFEGAMRGGRLGLLGMRERAEMMGGTLTIESTRGYGTTLYVEVPLDGVFTERAPEADQQIPVVEPAGKEDGAAPDDAAGAANEASAVSAREAAELARAKALSDVLVEIMAGAARSSSGDEILSLILDGSAAAIGCDTVHVDVRDGEDWVTRYDYQGTEVGRRFSDPQVPALMWVERTREVLVVNDTGGEVPDDALRLAEYGVRSYASVPLMAHNTLQGVLSFINFSAPEPFTPSEIAFFDRLAGLGSLALENIQLREVEARQRDDLEHRVEELQVLLDVLPIGIGIAYDPECKDIRVNPAFAQMLGIAPRENASLSADVAERPANFRVRIAGRDVAPEALPMQVAAAQGQDVRGVVADVIRDDGKTLTLLEYAVPLRGANGEPRGSVGAFVDITERVAADVERERLRAENLRQGKLLADLVAALPLGICVLSGRDYRYRMVNGVYEKLTGFPADRLIGRTVAEVFPTVQEAAYRLMDQAYATGETVWVHEQLFDLGPGREESYWDAAYVPVWDEAGEITGILSVAFEVTGGVLARKHAEQTAHTLKALLEYIPEGITIADAPDVTIRHVSRYGRDLLGGPHEDKTAGEVANQWTVFEPDGVTRMAEDDLPLVRAIRHGETVRNRKLVQINAQGRRLTLLCNAGPISDREGNITGGIVAWREM